MRWSYPYGTPETAAPVLGAQGDAREVFDALAASGYSGVELFVRDPGEIDRRMLGAALAQSGLAVAAIGTGPVVSDDNLTFTAADPGVRAAAVRRAKGAVDLAAELGCHINIGKLRGNVGSTGAARSWSWMRASLLQVAEHAAAAGVTIAIEPQNSSVIDNLITTSAGLGFVGELAHPNVALMVDAYHANIEDKWPVLAYVQAREVLRHVHFADSNRRAPGRGNIDFALHLAALDALGYDGFVTLELDQQGDWLATAKEAVGYLTALNRSGRRQTCASAC